MSISLIHLAASGFGEDPVIIPDRPTDFPTFMGGNWFVGALSSPWFWLVLYLIGLAIACRVVYNWSQKRFIEKRAMWVGSTPNLGLGKRLKLWIGGVSRIGRYRTYVTGVEWLWEYIHKMLHRAWLASPDKKLEKAKAAHEAYERSMHHLLTLSRKLNKAMSDLNKAVGGEKEVDPPAKAHAYASTGTVINIAVNQGNTVTAQGDASQTNHACVPCESEASKAESKPEPKLTDDEKRDAAWKAIDKLYTYWKNQMQISAVFMEAQRQLTRADYFVWPESEIGIWGQWRQSKIVPDELLDLADNPKIRKKISGEWDRLRKSEKPPRELMGCLLKAVRDEETCA